MSQLLKIFNLPPSLTLVLKKDVLILDFSAIANSQAAVTTAKISSEFAGELLNLSRASPLDVDVLK